MSKRGKASPTEKQRLEIAPVTALAVGVAIGISVAALCVAGMLAGGAICGSTVERGQMIQQHSTGESSRSIWQMEQSNGQLDE